MYYERFPNSSRIYLSKLSVGNWHELFRCTQCNQLWRIDIPDRLQEQYVLKVESNSDWDNYEISDLAKDLLLTSRGGLTDSICIVSGCGKNAVKGVVYCLEHLYQTGATR